MFKIGDWVILLEDIDDEYKTGLTGIVSGVDADFVYVQTDNDYVYSPHDMWTSIRPTSEQIRDLRCLLTDAFKRIEKLENRLDDGGFGYRR